MKTFLIVILSLALMAAAFFTRPSEASFRQHVRNVMGAPSGGGDGQPALVMESTDSFLDGCEFKDRYLWVSVVRDGQTLYTGAFAHWFDHGRLAELRETVGRAAARAEEV